MDPPSASTSGLPDSESACAPSAPVARTSTSAPVTSRTSIAATIPRGTLRSGSRASSAASGTPSRARKNQIANGTADQIPSQPNGRNAEAPAASVGGISTRLPASNSGTAATAKISSPTTAIAVITNMTLSASPTPAMWMPMNSTYAAR